MFRIRLLLSFIILVSFYTSFYSKILYNYWVLLNLENINFIHFYLYSIIELYHKVKYNLRLIQHTFIKYTFIIDENN